MSLSQLLNRPMTLVRRSDSGDVDEFGNDIPDETLVAIVGELQQGGPTGGGARSEPADHGELSDTRWTLYLPAGTVINTGDAVICDGQMYELVGDPWDARNPRTQVVSHIEATLRRTASASDETGS